MSQSYDSVGLFSKLGILIQNFEIYALASGSEIEVKKISLMRRKVWINTTRAQGFTFGCQIHNIDDAIDAGEVYLTGTFTSDQALTELKKNGKTD